MSRKTNPFDQLLFSIGEDQELNEKMSAFKEQKQSGRILRARQQSEQLLEEAQAYESDPDLPAEMEEEAQDSLSSFQTPDTQELKNENENTALSSESQEQAETEQPAETVLTEGAAQTEADLDPADQNSQDAIPADLEAQACQAEASQTIAVQEAKPEENYIEYFSSNGRKANFSSPVNPKKSAKPHPEIPQIPSFMNNDVIPDMPEQMFWNELGFEEDPFEANENMVEAEVEYEEDGPVLTRIYLDEHGNELSQEPGQNISDHADWQDDEYADGQVPKKGAGRVFLTILQCTLVLALVAGVGFGAIRAIGYFSPDQIAYREFLDEVQTYAASYNMLSSDGRQEILGMEETYASLDDEQKMEVDNVLYSKAGMGFNAIVANVRLSQRKEELESQIETLQAEVADISSSMASKASELKEAKTLLKDASSAMEDASKAFDTAQTKLAKLNDEIESAGDTITSYQDAIADLEDEIAELEESDELFKDISLRMKQNSLSTKQSQLESAQKSLEKKQSEVDSYVEESNQKQSAYYEQLAIYNEIQSQIDTIQAQYNTLSQDYQSKSDQLNSLQQELASLEG